MKKINGLFKKRFGHQVDARVIVLKNMVYKSIDTVPSSPSPRSFIFSLLWYQPETINVEIWNYAVVDTSIKDSFSMYVSIRVEKKLRFDKEQKLRLTV